MGKAIIALALIMCSLLILPLVAEKPLTVVDYYNAISGDKLTLQKGEWVSTRQIEAMGNYFQYNPAVVDIKNGYIEFEKGGAGGEREQHVLFLMKDGTPVIGKNYSASSDGLCDFYSSIEFKQKAGGGWKDITSRAMPKLDCALFLKKNYDTNKYNDKVLSLIRKYGKFIYQLPRYGLKVKIWVMTAPIRPGCRNSLNDSEKLILNGIGDLDIFRQREMTWDVESGTFKMLD